MQTTGHPAVEDGAPTSRTHVDGMVWVAGALQLRCTTTWVGQDGRPAAFPRTVVDGVVSSTTTITTSAGVPGTDSSWQAHGTRSVETTPVGDGDRVSVVVRTTCAVDLTQAPAGTPVRSAWDVYAENVVGDRSERVRVTVDDMVRPALVGARTVVAGRDASGGLTLDWNGKRRSIVDAAVPRLAAATARGTVRGSLTEVDLRLPLDGIRATSADRRDVMRTFEGSAELVAPVDSLVRRAWAKARRVLGAVRSAGPLELSINPDHAVLTARASAPAGLWQLVVTLHGRRRATPFLVRIEPDGTVELADTRAAEGRGLLDARAGRPAGDGAPLVSVIIPVHDAEAFIEATVRSVFDQTLPASEIEIIAVDDGSTDGSLALLRQLAESHPAMHVLAREASGGPAAPRNAGIDLAAGRYLFFLDADDLLTPAALEKLVEAARELDAQVVLGRMAGIGRERKIPRVVFRASDADADPVANSLMYALGPTKLFDARHVRERGLEFDTRLRRGEDQAFVAEAELTARRVAVLADGVYYLVRGHDEGHLSRHRESPRDLFTKTASVVGAIERGTGPGPRRDALLKRPFGPAALEGVFRPAFLKLDADARRGLVDDVADRFGHLWNDRLGDQLAEQPRVLLELVFQRRADLVTALLQHCGGRIRDLRYVESDGRLHLDVPPPVAAVVDPEILLAHTLVVDDDRLTSLCLERGRAVVTGWLKTSIAYPDAVSVTARWALRDGTTSVEATAEVVGSTRTARARTVDFRLVVDPVVLPERGLWDLSIALTSHGTASSWRRFGNQRTDGAPDEPLALDAQDVLYGTETYGNLSIDHGSVKYPAAAAPRVTAVRTDADGRPEAVIELPDRPGSEDSAPRVYADLDPAGSRGARHLLPLTAVGSRSVSARLPVPFAPSAARVTLTVASGGMLAVAEVPQGLRATSPQFSLEAGDGTLDITRTTADEEAQA